MKRPIPTPPFSSSPAVVVVLPTEIAHLRPADQQLLQNIPPIFADSRAALERELGAPLVLSTDDPGEGARWLIGPAACNPALAGLRAPAHGPELTLDRARQLLITDGPTPADVWETFSWLRSLARFPGGTLPIADCADAEGAIERVIDEVGDSYPAFDLRGLEWAAICARHVGRVRAAARPIPALQEWLAELGDGHTWVRPTIPLGDLPYELWVTEQSAVFTSVPPTTPAWAAGVRPGFRLEGQSPAAWWRRTASSPHARSLVAGRRLLAGAIGTRRTFAAVAPDGQRTTWRETIPAQPWEESVSWTIRPTGTGYLRVRSWRDAPALEPALEAAFSDLRAAPRLIVDLRGNPGGDLALAQRFRNRFLRVPTLLGWIRHSISHRQLSPPEPLYGEPAPEEQRWTGPVRFLTDPLTYSASEDVLLGLQGLAHVEVVGEPSGGGSGRIRSLRLLPGWRLTVSTALTYDRRGHCVEGAGIPIDRLVVPDRGAVDGASSVLEAADRDW